MHVSPTQHQSLRTTELDYHLPAELIATQPVEPRDSARMLVVRRSSERIEHRSVLDLPTYLNPGDAVVFNTTAVAPARFLGRRAATGGQIEGLHVREIPSATELPNWEVMLKAGGRLRAGDEIQLLDHHNRTCGLTLKLIEKNVELWRVVMVGATSTSDALKLCGLTPLPPYIRKARGEGSAISDEADRRWYQTIYADASKQQSVAAPTAGLHFTPELLASVSARGGVRVDVTLHVGLGTFQPVTAATLAEHQMHSEAFEASVDALAALRKARQAGARILAVGTTSVRTLESLPNEALDLDRQICGPIRGMTDLLIAPPHEFKHVDGMLTNFHLPRSTLLALVAAMIGLDRLKSIYREAINEGYRFYSYGDAMLILP